MTAACVDSTLLNKAMGALLQYHEKTGSNPNALLGDERTVQVQFALDKVPSNPSQKPRSINIPHPLYKLSDDIDESLQEPRVCLIVKEQSKKWVQEMIDDYPEQMGFVKKVLGLQSLRTKHGRFDQQRDLLNRFDVFMADDRILPMLAKALGRNFFETKKQPIPIRLTRKNALPLVVLQSLRSTQLYISEGTCITIK